MRCVTYGSPATSGRRVSIVDGDEIRGLVDDGQLIDLLGDDGTRLAAAADSARRDPYEVVPLATAVLAAPVPTPPSVRDFMAFKAHVTNSMRALGRDVDPDWYKLPVFYFTNPAAVHGPYDEVAVSPGSAQFDYELVEVAAVVGREDVDLHPEDAEAHIAGYTILCGWRPGTCRCARCASSSALSRARIPRRRWAWPWSTTPPRSCSAKPSRPGMPARGGTLAPTSIRSLAVSYICHLDKDNSGVGMLVWRPQADGTLVRRRDVDCCRVTTMRCPGL